ncbi:tyrosine-protein kinase hopscotch [Drosophila kikkawai]|uniref:Tyrosine-protein kinase hopscotch n=1 Tax=Drosophila kikkawai TaxID=30033 RepID=A0A6P4IHI6_DROKI|nr:tyrosine-protein kinase hopscotch [Drosophila kikkawai]
MDDCSSGRTSLADSASLTNASMRSGASSSQSVNTNDGTIRVWNYKSNDYEHFYPTMTCEDIRTAMCRLLGIAPTAQLLYGIREHATSRRPSPLVRLDLTWVMPGERLHCQLTYCFRMRFRVPELDSQLDVIDLRSHDFLYSQMRYDLLHELISEIKYPDNKDKSTGLAVIDMMVDRLEQSPEEQLERSIEKNYKMYLPPSLWRAHSFFVGNKIREVFRNLSANSPSLERLKWHYVHQVSHLAPTYMTEQYTVTVQCLPNEDLPMGGGVFGSGHLRSVVSSSTSTLASTESSSTVSTLTTNNPNNPSTNGGSPNASISGSSGKKSKRRTTSTTGIDVYVRVFPHDSAEPGLKVARVTSEATLKWILLGRIEDIFMISKINSTNVRLEVVGLPKGYEMQFQNEKEMKSFISYLSIYKRMSSKWMQDLCHSYRTPSLAELDSLHCHGPIGGAYSLMKLHEHNNKCGSYIIRECDREYNVYYIDIITKIIGKDTPHQRCKTETFRIVRKDSQWKLNINNNEHTLNSPEEVARFIQAEVTERIRIPASMYDTPPLLLLLLPKNLKAKKTDLQLSEAELQRRNPQIFNPKTDLQWYPDSISLGDDGMMFTMRGDWIQQSPVKDVSVTMKMMKSDGNFMEFFRLAQSWTLIQSPQFLKLYGLTLSDPYTMVMEYPRYGALNKFLYTTRDISMDCLLDLMQGLVRGMHYLEDNKIIHNYIRCSNLYVTKYDPGSGGREPVLDAKISDPGYPRPYRESDSPWIPTKYYRNLQAAKKDLATQLWAFATTTYEIFTRCRKDLRQLTQADLQRQRLLDGNILPLLDPDICPPPIFETIMDGWSEDPTKRFKHHDIFSRLVSIKSILKGGAYHTPSLAMNGTGEAEDGESVHELHVDNIFPSADMLMVVELNDCRLLYCESDKIGEGNFGVVYRGHLEYYDKERPRERVAVKKLKAMQVSMNDFKREMQIMRTLDHPNVVKFKYWSESLTSIVMEFLFASFKTYLGLESPKLNNARLIGYALDIAHGMKYLSDMGLIHRDLSTRNVLVDRTSGKDCLKISDFGLAQFANSDGYYLAQNNRELPIMWYSPEALATNKFSSYSDVWSYGVTLFETFSIGGEPILEPVEPSETFLNRLLRGDRLPRPSTNCPEFIYDLMLMCWHITPKSRPSFATIVELISREVGVNVFPLGDQQQPHPHQQLPPNMEGGGE